MVSLNDFNVDLAVVRDAMKVAPSVVEETRLHVFMHLAKLARARQRILTETGERKERWRRVFANRKQRSPLLSVHLDTALALGLIDSARHTLLQQEAQAFKSTGRRTITLRPSVEDLIKVAAPLTQNMATVYIQTPRVPEVLEILEEVNDVAETQELRAIE